MRSLLVITVIFAVMGLCSNDAAAMCAGGGMGSGGGGISAVGNGGSVGVGMNGVSSGGSGSGRAANRSAAKDKEITKAPLPPAVEIPGLDTSKFDKILASLKLTDEQKQKLTAAAAEIKDNISKLNLAQTDARAAYDKAVLPSVIYDAGRKVMDAGADCKSFDPNRKYELAVTGVLTADQRARYRELTAKS